MDVLVENYRPTVMPRAGLGFEALHEVNPRLIYAQLSGLGYDGPYAQRGGFDLIAQGMGGIMHVTGEPDGPPTSVGLPICDLGTGMWAVQGILAALYDRQRTGVGRLGTAPTGHRVYVPAAAGVPCCPVYNYQQLFADPQVCHRGLIQHASDPELGEVPHIRTPIKIGESVRLRTVAPKLGQHNTEI